MLPIFIHYVYVLVECYKFSQYMCVSVFLEYRIYNIVKFSNSIRQNTPVFIFYISRLLFININNKILSIKFNSIFINLPFLFLFFCSQNSINFVFIQKKPFTNEKSF